MLDTHSILVMPNTILLFPFVPVQGHEALTTRLSQRLSFSELLPFSLISSPSSVDHNIPARLRDDLVALHQAGFLGGGSYYGLLCGFPADTIWIPVCRHVCRSFQFDD